MDEFKGDCIGVQVHDRDENDLSQLVTVMIEDDEVWHKKLTTNAFWLDEMISKLQDAKDHLEKNCIKEKFGYRRVGQP